MNPTYAKAKAEHRCTWCWKQDERTLQGYSLCERCRETGNRKSRDRRERLKAEHRCIYCGERDEWTLTGKIMCDACRIRHNVIRRKGYKADRPPVQKEVSP